MNRSAKRRADAPAKSPALNQEVSRLVRQALSDALLSEGAFPVDQVALTVGRAGSPSAPEFLARSHPAGAPRDEARSLYARCLAHYRAVVRPQDQASGLDDVGAAVAHFVAACLRALRGVSATSDMLLRLERQLCGVTQRTGSWPRMAARERQFFFEQVAILAVLISETWTLACAQSDTAMANVQRAAARYLRQLFGIDASTLTLDAEGLRWAEPASAAARPAA
jgi:hypothetical protein